MKVSFKKLHEDAVTPQYAHPGSDAGIDLTATEVSKDGKIVTYHTGLAIEIPKDHVGLLFPRSSVSNYPLSLCSCVGVVDHGYTGEILFKYRLTDLDIFASIYNKGDRIGQLIIMPYPQIELVEQEALGSSERGSEGFGSTDLTETSDEPEEGLEEGSEPDIEDS